MADSKSKDEKQSSDDEPIQFDWKETGSNDEISHSPLTIGREVDVSAAFDEEIAPPAERITGMKTFYTKLFIGSISILDEQITTWLKDNPNIRIKSTNVVTGPIIDKSTEPHLIVTVWY